MHQLSQRIEPFRGLLYDSERAGSLRDLIAPPYDLIGPELQQRLYERNPHNIVRIELAREPDRYQASARMLRDWIAGGIMRRATRPTIYHYTQRFAIEGQTRTRVGLMVRLRLESFSAGRIRPHERTFPAAKEDRLRLLTTTETNVSPIFGLYEGRHPELAELCVRVGEREALLSATDDSGIENELREIAEPGEIELVQRALEAAPLLIADGHHRYETALEYRRRRREANREPTGLRPYDYTLAALVACDDPGLVILATHRVVRRLAPQALTTLVARAPDLFEVETVTDRAELRRRLHAAGRGAIGVTVRGQKAFYLMRLRDRGAMASVLPNVHAAVRELDVSILHSAILDRLCGISPEAVRAGGNIEYTIDFDGALDAVARGDADAAFLMNPPTIEDVERVSAAGATMPEKSTYFFPKLATGLVLNPLDD